MNDALIPTADGQCTATSKRTGERCKSPAIRFGTVCKRHGGAAPQVQRTAREMMAVARDMAAEALVRALRKSPPCPTCGRSDSDKDPVVVRAAQIVLDRTGFHPTVTVQQGGGSGEAPDFLRWIPDARQRQMAEWVLEAKRDMQRGLPLPERVVDAVVVGDTEETEAHLE